MTISELGKEAMETATEKGFFTPGEAVNVDQKLLLIVSEICEVQNEIRNGHLPTEIYYNGEKPEGVPIEFADAVIRIAQDCEALGIDLQAAIEVKTAYNRTRPYKHGKKF